MTDREEDVAEHEQRMAQSWVSNAAAWTRAVRERAIESRRLVTDAAVVEAVLGCPGRRVLDVGCGEGWLARRLAGAGRDVTGIDGSAQLIEQARQAGAAAFIVLDYDELARDPAAVGAAFDLAVCNFSLLGERITPVLRAIRRIVVPDGRLVVQTVHPFSVESGDYRDGWRSEAYHGLPGDWQPMPWFYRTLSSWVRALRDAGWHIDSLVEPPHPQHARPASLIIVATAADG